jgi:resuscitation-promoting factor RpfB
MPGETEHWSTVLLARQTTSAKLASRLRPLTERVRGIAGRTDARRPLRLLAQGGALLGVVAGTVAFASYDKSVTLTVDDHTQTVHAFASDVGDVLHSQGIRIDSHDLVSPSPTSSVHDGEHLVVRYGRQLNVNIDGQQHTYWTTALTVQQALAELGLRDDDAALSVSRSEPLGRAGLALSLTTPKEVTLTVDGRRIQQVTTAANVGVLLSQLGVTLGPQDTVSVPMSAPVTSGLVLTVTRVMTRMATVKQGISMPVTKSKNSAISSGTTKVVTKGHAGSANVTYQLIYENGRLVERLKVTTVVLTAAVTQVEQVGTKASASSSSSSTGAAGNPGSPGGSAASLNWAALAKCESGGNPKAVNPNGYYGLYQFSLATWHSVGGSGNPIDASAAEQTSRAEMLYNKAGAGQWTCGGHLFD